MNTRHTFVLTKLLLSSTLMADIRPIISVGYEAGGEELVTAELNTGEESINTGDGLFIEGGVSISTNNLMETQLLVGYKMESIEADNGDIDFSRPTFSALAIYHIYEFNIGGGITYHIEPEIEGSGYAADLSGTFDDALGGIVQIGYALGTEGSIGARFTFITYETNNYKAESDSAGIYLSFSF